MFFHDFAGGADIAVTSTILIKLPLTFNKLAVFLLWMAAHEKRFH